MRIVTYRKVSPCAGCCERKTACSDNCPKDSRGEFGYGAWKKERAAAKESIRREKSYMSDTVRERWC